MEKIKVSKEIFEAFEILKDCVNTKLGLTYENIFEAKIKKTFTQELMVLNNMDFDLFLYILNVGCESEETKEEKLLSRYDNININDYRNGIRDALDIMGINVKGINC